MAKAAGAKAIKIAHVIINFFLLTVLVILILFVGYTVWGSNQVYDAADAAQYALYKPSNDEVSPTFTELQAINPEVIAWVTVYGTSIDYPVVRGEDNSKYVNTNVLGEHSLSGAIFLDSDNDAGFSDFNNILYGHHMQKNKMFGDLGKFASEDFFASRRYGNLYVDGKDHGLEFFAFVRSDAYDAQLFTANIKGEDPQSTYLYSILERALCSRDIDVSREDKLVLLTTCSSYATNGRDILVARISDRTYADTFYEEKEGQLEITAVVQRAFGFPMWLLTIGIPLSLVIALVIVAYKKSKNKNSQGSNKK